jgi:hypothetical protein
VIIAGGLLPKIKAAYFRIAIWVRSHQMIFGCIRSFGTCLSEASIEIGKATNFQIEL